MLSMMSRSRWVPTSRTSWPLSASGKLSAVAMMPDPRTLTVVIVFPPKSQNKVRTKYRADQTSSFLANPLRFEDKVNILHNDFLSSSLRWTHAMDGRTHAGPRPAAQVPPARRNGRLVASLSSAARARCALPIRAEGPQYLWGRWQPPPGLRCAALV